MCVIRNLLGCLYKTKYYFIVTVCKQTSKLLSLLDLVHKLVYTGSSRHLLCRKWLSITAWQHEMIKYLVPVKIGWKIKFTEIWSLFLVAGNVFVYIYIKLLVIPAYLLPIIAYFWRWRITTVNNLVTTEIISQILNNLLR